MARDAAEQRAVRRSTDCGSSVPLASEKSAQGEEMGRRRSEKECKTIPYEKMRDDRSRRSECTEPNNAVSFAERAESSSESAGSRKMHLRAANSEINVCFAVIEVADSLPLQRGLIKKYNKYSSTGVLRHVTVPSDGMGNKAISCGVVRSAEPLRVWALD